MSDKPCEKCGHCPTCGRSNAPVYPWGTYPYWPPRPWYGPTYINHPLRGQSSAAGTRPNGINAYQLSNAV